MTKHKEADPNHKPSTSFDGSIKPKPFDGKNTVPQLNGDIKNILVDSKTPIHTPTKIGK